MFMKKIKRYFKVWWLMSRNAFMGWITHRIGATTFIIGKLIRFGFFLIFLVFILKGSKTIAGYNLNQAVFFFLTFNLIDVFAQFLFREVYRFRPLVISGALDLVLVKPISALFRSLMGGADLLDLMTIPPLIIAVIIIGKSFGPTPLQIISYILLIVNGLVIAAAFHIAVLSLAIITLEIDHTIMIYRDLTSLGRFPIDIYKEPIKGILTYLIPVGIMISFPAKVLMGVLSIGGVLWSIAMGAVLLTISISFWNFALKKYTSASS